MDVNQPCPTCEELRAKLTAAERERDELRRQLVSHREKAQGNYWAWDTTGDNHVESLVCPVLIHATDLKAILNERDTLAAKCAAIENAITSFVGESGLQIDSYLFQQFPATSGNIPLLQWIRGLFDTLSTSSDCGRDYVPRAELDNPIFERAKTRPSFWGEQVKIAAEENRILKDDLRVAKEWANGLIEEGKLRQEAVKEVTKERDSLKSALKKCVEALDRLLLRLSAEDRDEFPARCARQALAKAKEVL